MSLPLHRRARPDGPRVCRCSSTPQWTATISHGQPLWGAWCRSTAVLASDYHPQVAFSYRPASLYVCRSPPHFAVDGSYLARPTSGGRGASRQPRPRSWRPQPSRCLSVTGPPRPARPTARMSSAAAPLRSGNTPAPHPVLFRVFFCTDPAIYRPLPYVGFLGPASRAGPTARRAQPGPSRGPARSSLRAVTTQVTAAWRTEGVVTPHR